MITYMDVAILHLVNLYLFPFLNVFFYKGIVCKFHHLCCFYLKFLMNSIFIAWINSNSYYCYIAFNLDRKFLCLYFIFRKIILSNVSSISFTYIFSSLSCLITFKKNKLSEII